MVVVGGSAVIIGQNRQRVDETVEELSKDGPACGITAEPTDRDQVERVRQQLADERADATLQVNAAGPPQSSAAAPPCQVQGGQRPSQYGRPTPTLSSMAMSNSARGRDGAGPAVADRRLSFEKLGLTSQYGSC